PLRRRPPLGPAPARPAGPGPRPRRRKSRPGRVLHGRRLGLRPAGHVLRPPAARAHRPRGAARPPRLVVPAGPPGQPPEPQPRLGGRTRPLRPQIGRAHACPPRRSPDRGRALAEGTRGRRGSYMAGAWDCDRLDMFFGRLLRAHIDREVQPARLAWLSLQARLVNRQNRSRAWEVGRAHYDLGNDFYQAMLDPWLAYSCGYWKDADDLASAQEAKLDLICRKLGLKPGMRVLDIGCGWGSFMAYAATHYGIEAVGVTISKQQAAYASERYKDLPLEFRLQDYRELEPSNIGGKVDRIVSVGMFEHVGGRNHRDYMQVARRCLADDGLFLLHTIGKLRRSAV